jgi:hypothetical protein
MGLASIVRRAVAVANRVTGGSDGLQVEVSHEAWIGNDKNGGPRHDPSPRLRMAIVDLTGRQQSSTTGKVFMQRASVLFLEPVEPHGAEGRTEPFDQRDQIVLPNGTTLPDGTTGPLYEVVGGVVDPKTGLPFLTELRFGVDL